MSNSRKSSGRRSPPTEDEVDRWGREKELPGDVLKALNDAGISNLKSLGVFSGYCTLHLMDFFQLRSKPQAILLRDALKSLKSDRETEGCEAHDNDSSQPNEHPNDPQNRENDDLENEFLNQSVASSRSDKMRKSNRSNRSKRSDRSRGMSKTGYLSPSDEPLSRSQSEDLSGSMRSERSRKSRNSNRSGDQTSEDKDSDRGFEEEQSTKSKKSGSRKKAGTEVDNNFRPINILVYRNGDEYDRGTIVSVTRRQFRNWTVLLDFLTKTLGLKEGAVHNIFDLDDGQECRHFKDLQDGARYVGASGRLKKANYGSRPNKKWIAEKHYREQDPNTITSGESYKKYLERRDFQPKLDDMWEDSEFDLRRGGGGQKKSKKPDAWAGVDKSPRNSKSGKKSLKSRSSSK